MPDASPDPKHAVTRVRVAELGIDLPVVKATTGYPPCDVALVMAATGLRQPGQGGATYLYAHARPGMFLPLLETPEARQRGLRIEVWTSDDFKYVYQVIDVRRDQQDLTAAQTGRARAALAPDLRGAERVLRQDPGRGGVRVRGSLDPRCRAPEGPAQPC